MNKKIFSANKFSILLIILAFLIPYLLIYRVFFSMSPLAWGDAPYFYPENLVQLFNKPFTWDFRNTNFSGPQFLILWLYLPTFLMGLLNHLLNISSEVLVRLVFYFPATILGFIGSYLYIRQFVGNRWASFLGSLLYSFNTYSLLLIDGGQIGVALGYSLFPWTILAFKNLLIKQTIKNFIFCLLVVALLTNIDLRIAILALFTFLLINFWEGFFSGQKALVIKAAFIVFKIMLPTLLINGFWILSFINNFSHGQISGVISSNNFLSLLNGLLLFNPHFPNNEFGHLIFPPFYFALLPILIFGGLINKLTSQKKALYLSVLTTIFLLKGTADPLSGVYSWFLGHVPLAEAFRDSSKFFIPTIFISAILLSQNLENWFSLIKNKFLQIGSVLVIYIYILGLVSPGFLGGLTGILVQTSFSNDYKIIYQQLKTDSPFFRSVWFPETPPLAFSGEGKETISANLLYQERPFAAMIKGNYDLFYFLHNPLLADWWKLLGVKYAFFPMDERQKTWTPQELIDRQLFLKFIDKLPGWEKLNWPISFPAYKVENTQPKIFTQPKALIIVGDQMIYQQLKSYNPNFSLMNQGFIFLEDGILNPNSLLDLPSTAANLVFLNRGPEDLTMVFLQDKFLTLDQLSKSSWGQYSPSQYLKLNDELLNHGIESKDFGFDKGLTYSSITGEKMIYKKSVSKEGDYLLATRVISASDSAGIKINIDHQSYATNSAKERFTWNIWGPFHFQVGEQIIEIENQGGFNAVNVVSLFNTQDLDEAQRKAEDLMDNFPNFNLANKNDQRTLGLELQTLTAGEVAYEEIDPTNYEIDLNKNSGWIVFSDHYNKDWLVTDQKLAPFPLYSMINGFYFTSADKVNLYFMPQDQIDVGIKVSIISILIIAVVILIVKVKKG